MTNHYVAYLRWDVREDWKRLGGSKAGDRRLYPYAYGSNWRHFPKFVRPGTTLWIVAAPLYREQPRGAVYRLPPTLVARLAVARLTRGTGAKRPKGNLSGDEMHRRVLPGDYAWVAEADRASSCYFPINNAFYVLTDVEFVDQRGRRRRIPKQAERFDRDHPYQHVPHYLQILRRLAPGCEGGLETLARTIEERRTLFLSYAREESFSGRPEFVSRFVEELRRRDFAPWIDLASVPQPDPGVWFEDSLLRQILDDGLRQASLMVALTGPLYRKHDWTRVEWDLAMARSREEPLGMLQVKVAGQVMDAEVDAIEWGNPSVTARRIRDWWDANMAVKLRAGNQ